MYANPKGTTSLRLDATMKHRGRELLALHGMTLTEAFEEYMDELVYRGDPPMRASREATKANTMRIRFDAFMESGLGAGEEGEHPGEGGRKMSSSAKMRKLSVRIDADLKASFEDTLRGIGVDPTCAMRSRRLPGWPWAPFLGKAGSVAAKTSRRLRHCGNERRFPSISASCCSPTRSDVTAARLSSRPVTRYACATVKCSSRAAAGNAESKSRSFATRTKQIVVIAHLGIDTT